MLIIDTGILVLLPAETFYRQHFARCPLTELKVKLVTCAKGALLVIGCQPAAAAIADQVNKVPACLYKVKAETCLLGLDLIKVLSISIPDGKVRSTRKGHANAPSTFSLKSTVYSVGSTPAHHQGTGK